MESFIKANVAKLRPLAESELDKDYKEAGWLLTTEVPEDMQDAVAKELGYARGMIADKNNPGKSMRGWRKIIPRNTMVNGANAAIFDDEGRILLGQRWNSKGPNGEPVWEVPGGGNRFGESYVDCCLREAGEETGFKVQVVGLCGIFSAAGDKILEYADGERRQCCGVVLACKVVGGELDFSNEAEDMRWFTPDEARQLAMTPLHRYQLDIALTPVVQRPFIG